MNSIKTNLNIKTIVRIHVLHDIIENLAFSLGFPHDIEKILEKGIVKKQIIGTIYAFYINEKGLAVGQVSFEIDWEMHDMFVNTDTGSKIEIRNNIPLIDQFAYWARDIVNYVNDMKKNLNVKKVIVLYQYRPEIKNGSEEEQEADEFLGLRTSTNEIQFDTNNNENFKRRMSFISEFLPELKICIENK